MKRIPWDIVLALLAGLVLGLIYSWGIAPLRLVDTEPSLLRADFKDQFRVVIAASYASTGNLPRAQARLSLLGDINPLEALNSQAQRTIANGQLTQADQLAELAFALENGGMLPQPNLAPIETSVIPDAEATITPFPSPADLPFVLTETPQVFEIQPSQPPATINTLAPRPTRTPVPTQGAPFQLSGQDTVCDVNLTEGLLQVIVYNPNHRQMAGVRIIVTWESGEEEFFTGLKPELGNGYADFVMTPDITYAVQLGTGSDLVTGLTVPTCQTFNGDTFLGGYKLTFQQP